LYRIIDPSKNSQVLEQILGKRVADISHLKRKYQPLSENYRGIDQKYSLQMANPNNIPNSNYHLIGRAGSRRQKPSSITPSGKKDDLLVSKLRDNYKNSNIANGGHYIPPTNLRKIA
jgi:hypothetical protein